MTRHYGQSQYYADNKCRSHRLLREMQDIARDDRRKADHNEECSVSEGLPIVVMSHPTNLRLAAEQVTTRGITLLSQTRSRLMSSLGALDRLVKTSAA